MMILFSRVMSLWCHFCVTWCDHTMTWLGNRLEIWRPTKRQQPTKKKKERKKEREGVKRVCSYNIIWESDIKNWAKTVTVEVSLFIWYNNKKKLVNLFNPDRCMYFSTRWQDLLFTDTIYTPNFTWWWVSQSCEPTLTSPTLL